MSSTKTRTANRLINEKSPYLLQHAYNPVDWYPWGEEAFREARNRNIPVFLSIGFSSCHWCHVMERESFEDPAVAELLNKHFVSIKVDREERPDLDQIYMAACQALTGQGGWPLTVFLTPEKKPFFAGTYFPKTSRHGLTGLLELLPRLASLWEQNQDKVMQAGEELLQAVRRQGRAGDGAAALPGLETMELAYRRLRDSFDERRGGFGGAPKFPVPHRLTFLLRWWRRSGEARALEMVTATLQAMARGGIFDQIGYGFHRYSTGADWLVPHFEKMLYDQALLAVAYLEYYQATGDPEAAAVARRIFEYVLRDLQTPEEAFCAAEDGDSEGEEGLFYVWTPAELAAVLGEERGRLIAAYFGVTEEGNFTGGKSVLHRPLSKNDFAARHGMDPSELTRVLDESRELLRQARAKRVRPFKDDKVIAAWNGLIIAALAKGAVVVNAPLYAHAARAAAAFILERMTDEEGRLLRRFRDGQAAVPAFLDDYAGLVWGLIELYQASLQAGYLRRAVALTQEALNLFEGEGGALNFASVECAGELPPLQDAYDGAEPAGNSVMALNLLRLGRMTGRPAWEERGEAIIRAFGDQMRASPASFTFMLAALDLALGPAAEVVIAGETGSAPVDRLANTVRHSFNPNTVLLFHPAGVERWEIETVAPQVKAMTAPAGKAVAYLCRDRSCLAPVSKPDELAKLLRENKPVKNRDF